MTPSRAAPLDLPEPAHPQPDRLDRTTWNLQIENDMFASDDDRHYTNGLRLSYLTKAEPCETGRHCLTGALRKMSSLVPGFGRGEERRVSYAIGQNMYTPTDISNPNLIANDRPYAGWLYAGFGFVTRDSYRRSPDKTFNKIDNFELNIGMVGPWSAAELTQKTWHKLFNFDPPRGWEHQLGNEPGLVLTYERVWQYKRKARLIPGLETEFAPAIGAAVGNIYTHAAAGARIRIGANLPDDYGPPRIRPSLPGSDYFTPKNHKFGFYAFAGVEGRAVARNIFLDGNTFRHSHSVHKKPFVADLQLGLALIGPDRGLLPPFRLSYTHILRSKEFDGQQSTDQFGSINLSFNF
ncbi:lipid A deacylase LpxR family protein [Govanella unica]|uniref:lipid A deacylase LpxR family protein n=1 Tax=Govanella unica TaxID=2975056 RepID=UPI003D2110FD